MGRPPDPALRRVLLRAAAATGRPTITEAVAGSPLAEPSVLLVRPVVSDGRAVGAVVGAIGVKWQNDVARAASAIRGGDSSSSMRGS